jgi:hypothetical protein
MGDRAKCKNAKKNALQVQTVIVALGVVCCSFSFCFFTPLLTAFFFLRFIGLHDMVFDLGRT